MISARDKPFVIFEAPSVLGLFPKGVEGLPEALLAAGLAERLGAKRAGRVEPPVYNAERDSKTSLLNPQGIAAYSIALAKATVPVVLGGDCSILLGACSRSGAAAATGFSFSTVMPTSISPRLEPNGEVASMDLALATGRGPAIVTDLEGRRPLVRDEDVVVLGRRDGSDAEEHGSQRVEDTAIGLIDVAAVRQRGVEAATMRAIERLSAGTLDGFWIHLDADVLDDAVMPAVDYRMPDGLAWDELSAVRRLAVSSGRAVGIDITIFNPKLDVTGAIARRFVHALAKGLCGAA